MSVPTWLQSEARTKFLWRLYKLNIRLAEIVSNHPIKYRATYGDKLINTALTALLEARKGNGVFMNVGTPDGDYRARRDHLKEAKNCVDAIAPVAYIYLELVRKSDGAKLEKILKQEEEIGLETAEISKMLKAVMDNDRKLHNARHGNGPGGQQ